MNNGMDLLSAWKQIFEYGPTIWVGILTIVVVFVLEIKLYNKNIIFSGQEKRIAKAKEKGHVINAKGN